jgi:nucleoside 2-deoxyribosyltransferase
MAKSIYLIGSLRVPLVRGVAAALREQGHDVFDDWHAAGPEADDIWQQYEKDRSRGYLEALGGYHAQHAFALDFEHLHRCDVGVMILPAGKSAHMELGYMRGLGKPAYILMEGEPERYDLMYLLATDVFLQLDDLLRVLK